MDTATGKLVVTKEESGYVDFSGSETWIFPEEAVMVQPIACKKATGKPNASSKSDCQGGPKAERKDWSHNLHVSPRVLARVLLCRVTSFVETQAGGLSMAARGSVVRRREKHEIVVEARTSLSENGDDHCGPPQLSQSYRDRDRRASWYTPVSRF